MLMQSRRPVAAVFLLCLGLITFGVAFEVRSFQTPNSPRQSPNPKFDAFPVVDFDVPEPTDLALKSAKEAKDRKYTRKYLPKISENTRTLFTVNDWDVGLRAIPIDKSSAIVIGTITKAEAHITRDKTAIYSEFVLSPDVIVKNDSENPIEVDRSISFERSGGRMPSGKIIASWTTATHEGGHGLGLDNAVNCPEGTTIMNPGSFIMSITPCDNETITSTLAAVVNQSR
jgi:hypothetical protein